MAALVRIALRLPYTFVVLALLILIAGGLAAVRMPIDIFPGLRLRMSILSESRESRGRWWTPGRRTARRKL